MVLVCNKTDVKDASFAKEWMTNFEAFQAAVRAEKSVDGEEGMGYMGSLMGSMGLVLEEFYHHLDVRSRILGTNDRLFRCRRLQGLGCRNFSRLWKRKSWSTRTSINLSLSDEFRSGRKRRRRRELTN
jgi:Conserved hypothetical ATP binding protein